MCRRHSNRRGRPAGRCAAARPERHKADTTPFHVTGLLAGAATASPSDDPPTLPADALPRAGAAGAPAPAAATGGAGAVETKSWWDDLQAGASWLMNGAQQAASQIVDGASQAASQIIDGTGTREAADYVMDGAQDAVQETAAVVRDGAAWVASDAGAARPALALVLAGAGAALLLAA